MLFQIDQKYMMIGGSNYDEINQLYRIYLYATRFNVSVYRSVDATF